MSKWKWSELFLVMAMSATVFAVLRAAHGQYLLAAFDVGIMCLCWIGYNLSSKRETRKG